MSDTETTSCNTPGCCGEVDRRSFLKTIGLSLASSALTSPVGAMAGPFTRPADGVEHFVPEDKKLSAEWVKALFERGRPEVWTGKALDTIGMPIGGIGAGQLYLTGDGRLACWQIFNHQHFTGWGEKNYQYRTPDFPVESGFTLRVGQGGDTQERPLDKTGFKQVEFQGEYPLGHVRYRDEAVPVEVDLEAFSPFIPLNSNDSTLPATLLHFRVKNSSSGPLSVAVDGRLANAVLFHNAEKFKPLKRVTRREGSEQRVVLIHSASPDMPMPPPPAEPKPEEFATMGPTEALYDFGGMALGLNGSHRPTDTPDDRTIPAAFVELAPGQAHTFTYVVAWHFPNLYACKEIGGNWVGREYANRFKDAAEVAGYVLDHQERLTRETRLWHDTFYDSTLPHWLLNRIGSTLANLATGTTQIWSNGRFWGWEGVGCCHGTCTHVWNYAHALARLFPDLERSVREMQDLKEALHGDGLVGFRGVRDGHYAADGQCGTVLKCWREHLMSTDDAFLKRNWPNIKRVLEHSIRADGNDDGLLEGGQHNTYDVDFQGPNSFVGALYLAALRAGEEMARLMGETDFAARLRAIFTKGQETTHQRLWNGEYYYQEVDLTKHPKFQYADGCLSDQVFGQHWAHQVALGYVYPPENVRKALTAVWKYNWAPDIAPQNAKHKPERWFVAPGEAGLFTCTWPRSRRPAEPVRYRDEVWTGIEYQVAGHMIWEGMLTEALAIVRAIHDRYHPLKHNPYNEIECGDHYARALASWGVFTALSGFACNGPAGRLGFAPRFKPEDFKTAFTTAEGWGTFAQRQDGDKYRSQIDLQYGQLKLSELKLGHAGRFSNITARVNERKIALQTAAHDGAMTIRFAPELVLTAGQSLQITATTG